MLQHGLHAEIGPAKLSVTVEGTHSCRHVPVVTATAILHTASHKEHRSAPTITMKPACMPLMHPAGL